MNFNWAQIRRPDRWRPLDVRNTGTRPRAPRAVTKGSRARSHGLLSREVAGINTRKTFVVSYYRLERNRTAIYCALQKYVYFARNQPPTFLSTIFFEIFSFFLCTTAITPIAPKVSLCPIDLMTPGMASVGPGPVSGRSKVGPGVNRR